MMTMMMIKIVLLIKIMKENKYKYYDLRIRTTFSLASIAREHRNRDSVSYDGASLTHCVDRDEIPTPS